MTKLIIGISLAAVATANFQAAHASDKNVLNSNYHVREACKVFFKSDSKDKQFSEDHKPIEQSNNNDTTVYRLKPKYLLTHLENTYKTKREVSDYSSTTDVKSPEIFFKAKLLKRIKADPKMCADKPKLIDSLSSEENNSVLKKDQLLDECYYPMSERLSGDSGALKIRQSLLMIFNAAEKYIPVDEISNSSEAEFLIVINPKDGDGEALSDGEALYPEWPVDPKANEVFDGHIDRINKQAGWLSAFINDRSKDRPVNIFCMKTETQDKALDVASIVETIAGASVEAVDAQIMTFTDTMGKWTNEPNVERKKKKRPSGEFKFVKDPSQFSKSKPEAAKLGMTFAGDASGNDLKTTAAFGLVFTQKDDNLSTPRWKCKTGTEESGKGCKTTAGAKRTYSLYVAYDQSPSTIKVLDKQGRTISDGNPLTTESQFADGTLTGGFRLDYEDYPRYRDPDNRQDQFNILGRTPPGNKAAFAVEYITDNYSDLQAIRAELSYSPRYSYIERLPGARFGYRHPSRVRGFRLLGLGDLLFEWDGSVVIDHIDYARQPRDRDFDAETPRKNLGEFSRYGGNGKISLSTLAPFGVVGEKGRLELSLERKYREPFDGDEGSATHDKLSIAVKDPREEQIDLSLSYHEGKNIVTLRDKEYVALELKIKLN